MYKNNENIIRHCGQVSNLKNSPQKGSVLPGVIILVFILMLTVLVFVAALGTVKNFFDGPCNWLKALDKILSSGLADNLVCDIATGELGGSGSESGEYTYSGKWICSGSDVDVATKGDPVKAYGDSKTTVYEYSDGSTVGYTGGTHAWRNNNPGNIEKSTLDAHIGDDGRFAVFKNYQSGFDAISALLRRKYNSFTILATMRTYAPEKDGNNPDQYAADIAKDIGKPTDTLISSLSNAELIKVANTIQRVEGTTAGTIKDECIAIAPPQITASKNIISFEGRMSKTPSWSPELSFDEGFGNALLGAIAEAKSNGIEISIISGFRSSGGGNNSNHTRGLAADIYATRNGASICERNITDNKKAGRADGKCDSELIGILNSYGIKNTICYENVSGFKGGDNDGDCSHFSTTGG